MDNGYTKLVRERVLTAEDGAVFATSDFADIANAEFNFSIGSFDVTMAITMD